MHQTAKLQYHCNFVINQTELPSHDLRLLCVLFIALYYVCLIHFHVVNGNSKKMVQVMIEIVITCPNLVFTVWQEIFGDKNFRGFR